MSQKVFPTANFNEAKNYVRLKNRKEGNETWLLGNLLFLLYGYSGGRLRKLIIKVLWKAEGSGLYSQTLRKIAYAYHQVEVGMYTRGPLYAPENYAPYTIIGRYCSIFPTVRAFAANHPMNTLSTHALFYNPALGFAKKDILTRTRLKIGNDVFIGHNAIITSSVSSIGNGAIIGAGSVVHQDIPPYAVVVGNPGRVVRYRFSKEVIQQLLDSCWWEKSFEELLPEIDRFQHPLEGEQIR